MLIAYGTLSPPTVPVTYKDYPILPVIVAVVVIPPAVNEPMELSTVIVPSTPPLTYILPWIAFGVTVKSVILLPTYIALELSDVVIYLPTYIPSSRDYISPPI